MDHYPGRDGTGLEGGLDSGIHLADLLHFLPTYTHMLAKKKLDKIPLKFSLCFGMGRTCRADLQPFCSLRKGGSNVQLMLSDSVH